MNNENSRTQEEEHHTPGPGRRWGSRGGLALGEIPNVDELMGAANQHSMCIPKEPAHAAHVPQNLM